LYQEEVLGKANYQAGKGAWIFAQRNQGASSAQEKLSVARRGCLPKGRSKDREH
jgi:hypothetical protein